MAIGCLHAERRAEMDFLLQVGTSVSVWDDDDPAVISEVVVDITDMSVKYFFEDYEIGVHSIDSLKKSLLKRGWNVSSPNDDV